MRAFEVIGVEDRPHELERNHMSRYVYVETSPATADPGTRPLLRRRALAQASAAS